MVFKVSAGGELNRQRARRIALGVVAVLFVVWAILTWLWILSPSSTDLEDVTRGDAVILFSAGEGPGLEVARELMEAGAAPVLVIPTGEDPEWRLANALCAGDRGYEVICSTPRVSTRGEARLVGDLALERRWNELLVVTSTPHLSRAEMLLDRCFAGEITGVAASPDRSIGGWFVDIAAEWLDHIEARVVRRGC